MKKISIPLKIAALLVLLLFNVVACVPERPHYIITTGEVATSEVLPTATQFTERPVYDPGTLVEYVVQSGDTLEHLAWRFGTTRREILFHNPDIPEDITTLPPGYPMQMPIYYKPFWGTSFQIIPDAAFVNGPDAICFDTKAFLHRTTPF